MEQEDDPKYTSKSKTEWLKKKEEKCFKVKVQVSS